VKGKGWATELPKKKVPYEERTKTGREIVQAPKKEIGQKGAAGSSPFSRERKGKNMCSEATESSVRGSLKRLLGNKIKSLRTRDSASLPIAVERSEGCKVHGVSGMMLWEKGDRTVTSTCLNKDVPQVS